MGDPLVGQRRRILARDYPTIPLTAEQAAEVEPTRITLKPWQVWVEVRGARKVGKGWFLDYIVRDDRPRLVRRNPHGVDINDLRSRMDEYGVPRRVNEQDAAEASEASHYTASIEQAVAREAEEVVPAEYQKELTMRARQRHLQTVEEERAEELARRQWKSFCDAGRGIIVAQAKLGMDPGPTLARMLQDLKADLEEERAA